MEHLEGILKLADNELEAIVKNGKFRSREEIDSVYKLIDIAKDIYCIWECEDGGEDGYSERGYSGNYPRYDDGGSYARGRRGNVRRDSMGRYSRDGGSYRRDGGSYRRDGYSRADGKEDYIEHLRDMAEEAPDEKTRQEIHRMIEKMEQA